MKRIMQLAAMSAIALLLQDNTLSSGSAFETGKTDPQKHALVEYTWFFDPYLTDPVGTISNVSQELDRLRSSYGPSFVFSSTPGMGLTPFEYGQFSYMTTVIYSNLY